MLADDSHGTQGEAQEETTNSLGKQRLQARMILAPTLDPLQEALKASWVIILDTKHWTYHPTFML